jgi:hypothetical protein
MLCVYTCGTILTPAQSGTSFKPKYPAHNEDSQRKQHLPARFCDKSRQTGGCKRENHDVGGECAVYMMPKAGLRLFQNAFL